MKSLIIWLFVLGFAGVQSHWLLPRYSIRYPATRRYSYPYRYPSSYYGRTTYPDKGTDVDDYYDDDEIAKGTIDQLIKSKAKWTCTNQDTGDKMIIGTENDETSKPGYPTRNLPGEDGLNPQRPQKPVVNPEEPGKPQQPLNPGFVEIPWTVFPGTTQSPSIPQKPSTTDPLKDFDWASYITSTLSTTPAPDRKPDFDGTGIIKPRVGA